MANTPDCRTRSWVRLYFVSPIVTRGASGIVDDLRDQIEAHCCAPTQVVFRPSTGSIERKRNPRGVHGVGELLWRVGSHEGFGFVAKRVEDERDLRAMTGAEPPVVLR